MLSEILYAQTVSLWEEAAEKPFVTAMALGTLDRRRFRRYMLQDYLYLRDYIDILDRTLEYTSDPELSSFLCDVIEETKKEAERVHISNLRKEGLQEADLKDCVMEDVIVEYLDYMKQELEEEGLLAGLTALLQCSWVYAYIAQTVRDRYPGEVTGSPFRDWFESYTCEDYLLSNQRWIDVLNREAAGISRDERDRLCVVFRTCAYYENRLWDRLNELPV